MILALIMSHQSGIRHIGEDFIQGKDQGFVMMLHGPLGCRKTLTAESIAEQSHRPLLAVNVADIELDAVEAEQNLQQSNGINRNALVSGEVLEYYNGIFILTTNQISSFDPAAQSRIHLTIRYPPLDRDQKSQILNNFFSKTENQGLLNNNMIKERVEAQVL
ncbi:hypothetical protein GQ44DRAFT_691019 [Phaeosphaeriaceae sp. PMI808]|nr:hypothetical protein GQ44DRAFT_691019 [Phaeosphaeriaceae sp. PMI808]